MTETFSNEIIHTTLIKLSKKEDIKTEINREEPDVNLAYGQLIGKQGGKIATLFREYLTELNQELM